MAQVAEQKLPEFLRPRPKYHFYNAWMRERIEALCPARLLPEPVVQKLLDIDAGDLHFMCQHPAALVAQVGGLMDDYTTNCAHSGTGANETWHVEIQLLSAGLVGWVCRVVFCAQRWSDIR
jgi:hypothetical protein